MNELVNIVTVVGAAVAFAAPIFSWLYRSIRGLFRKEIGQFRDEILAMAEERAKHRDAQIASVTASLKQLCDGQKEIKELVENHGHPAKRRAKRPATGGG